MVSMLFRDPQALSSALASLGTLQPRAFGSLNHIETLDSASNYYLERVGILLPLALAYMECLKSKSSETHLTNFGVGVG